MSTPADFKRLEEKKKKQTKMISLDISKRYLLQARTVAAIPQYTSMTSTSMPTGAGPGYRNNNNSWMYQPQPNHRQNFGRGGQPAYDYTRDIYGGQWYVDFSQPPNSRQPFRPQQNYPKNKPRKDNPKQGGGPTKELPVPVVKEAPISMNTMDFVIEPSNLVCFNGKFHFLSNMYPCNLVIDNNFYSSVEHYYQCTKIFSLIGPAVCHQMKGVTDAGQAKAEARRILHNIPKERIEEWKEREAPKIINLAIMEKFKQNPELRKQLAATGSAILAHCFVNDNLYATASKADEVKKWAKENSGQFYRLPVDCHNPENIDYIPLVAKGRNLLGALLMLTRKELGNETPAKKSSPRQSAIPVSMLKTEADRATDLMNTLNI